MHEVQLDFKSVGHRDVPCHFRVTGIGIREVGRLDLPKHVRQLDGIHRAEQQGTKGPGQEVPGKHVWGDEMKLWQCPNLLRSQSPFLGGLYKVTHSKQRRGGVAPRHHEQTPCQATGRWRQGWELHCGSQEGKGPSKGG